jgi:hypothetical protein
LADDQVWLEPPRPTASQSDWYPRAIQRLSGTVVAMDHQQLRFLRSGDEAETVVASRRVIWIEPGSVSSLESEAIELFRQRQYGESLLKLPEILKQRPPVWRQQWITMLAANAAWQSGRSKIALELVSQLDRRPLPLMAIAWLPVAWRGGVQPIDAVTEAKTRLADPSPAVQLVAASWLLGSANRSQATAVLRRLSAAGTSDDQSATLQRRELGRLAEILRWQAATPPQVIQSADQWQTQIDALPMVLQVGPTQTLIHKLRSAGQSDAANRLQWSLDLVPIHPHPLN